MPSGVSRPSAPRSSSRRVARVEPRRALGRRRGADTRRRRRRLAERAQHERRARRSRWRCAVLRRTSCGEPHRRRRATLPSGRSRADTRACTDRRVRAASRPLGATYSRGTRAAHRAATGYVAGPTVEPRWPAAHDDDVNGAQASACRARGTSGGGVARRSGGASGRASRRSLEPPVPADSASRPGGARSRSRPACWRTARSTTVRSP